MKIYKFYLVNLAGKQREVQDTRFFPGKAGFDFAHDKLRLKMDVFSVEER